jgi:hypothetical protein
MMGDLGGLCEGVRVGDLKVSQPELAYTSLGADPVSPVSTPLLPSPLRDS